MFKLPGSVAALTVACLLMAGCDKQTTTKEQKTVTSPGGETKVTTEHKVEKSGSNPPPANP